MKVFETVVVAFSMFSALPMPRVDWDQDNMRYSLCAFPLIGAVIGLVCWVWAAVCGVLALPNLLRGAGLCLIPVLVTGGIHLDGYADTWDALGSHADPERKQEILKDPRMGAFGGIHLCGYFVASFALWASLPRYEGGAVLLMLCLSRSLSGLAVASFPMAKNTGLAHTFAAAADKKRVRAVLTGLSLVLMALLCLGWGLMGAIMSLAVLGVFFWYRRMARKEFGGLSGDLAGWFLQTAELWMAGAMVFWQYGEALL